MLHVADRGVNGQMGKGQMNGQQQMNNKMPMNGNMGGQMNGQQQQMNGHGSILSAAEHCDFVAREFLAQSFWIRNALNRIKQSPRRKK